MSGEAKSTNVDSSDKLSNDLKNGIPEVHICCPVIDKSKLNENEFSIIVATMESRESKGMVQINSAIVENDTIIEQGGTSIGVKSLPRKQFEQYKKKLKSQQKETEELMATTAKEVEQ